MELFLVVLIILISNVYSIPTTITITSNMGYRYRNRNFYCVDGEDCNFLCNHIGYIGSSYPFNYGCWDISGDYTSGGCCGSKIYCSQNGNNNICDIECKHQTSCYQNWFYCGDNSNCNIQCNDIYSCYSSVFYCNDNSVCNFYCYEDNSCYQSTFYCGDNSQCNIYCNGHESCKNTNIYCGINSNCTLQCDAHAQYGAPTNKGFECQSMYISATDSNLLYIDIFNNNRSASDMTIYAPNSPNNTPNIIKCGINTYDNTPYQYSCDNIDIYAIDGWKDVELQINWMSVDNVFEDYTSKYNQMNCGDGYKYFCDGFVENILNNDMECHQAITTCNNFTFITTTNNPTAIPSDTPTTNNPTGNPSDVPSNIPSESPTKLPTESPLDPTKTPTLSPTDPGETSEPSDSPTKSPTDIPTDPSKSPTNYPVNPTISPTYSPTEIGETRSPSKSPTKSPTYSPLDPSESPTAIGDTTNPSATPTSSIIINTDFITTKTEEETVAADKGYCEYNIIVVYSFVLFMIMHVGIV